jgi:hypothetical protein
MTTPENWPRVAAATDEATGAVSTFWITALHREEQKVNAACRALGGLEFLVGPEYDGTPRTRLRRIREVVAELRDELGMPPLPPGPPSADRSWGGEAA